METFKNAVRDSTGIKYTLYDVLKRMGKTQIATSKKLSLKDIPADLFNGTPGKHKIVTRRWRWPDTSSEHLTVLSLLRATLRDRWTRNGQPLVENFKADTPGLEAKYAKLVIDIDGGSNEPEQAMKLVQTLPVDIFNDLHVPDKLRWYIVVDHSRKAKDKEGKTYHKSSYHVILPTIVVPPKQFTGWKWYFKHLYNGEGTGDMVDLSIYARGQLFRQPGAYKPRGGKEKSERIPTKITYLGSTGDVIKSTKDFRQMTLTEFNMCLISSVQLKDVFEHSFSEDHLVGYRPKSMRPKERSTESKSNVDDPTHMCKSTDIVCKLKPSVVEKLLTNAGPRWAEHDNRLRMYSAWKWLELKKGVELGTLYMPWFTRVRPDRVKPDSHYIKHYMTTDPRCTFYKVMVELNEEQGRYKRLKSSMIPSPEFDAYIKRMREIETDSRETSIREAIKRFCNPLDTDYLVDDDWSIGASEIMYKPKWSFEELASYIFSRVTIAKHQGKEVVIEKMPDGTYDIQPMREHAITAKRVPQVGVRSGKVKRISYLDYFDDYDAIYRVRIVMQNPWIKLPPKTVNIMPMPRIREPDMECAWYDEYKNTIISYIKDYHLMMEDNKDYWIDVILSWMSAVIFDYEPTRRMLIFSGPQGMGKSVIFHALQQILPQIAFEESNDGLGYFNRTTFKDKQEFKKLVLIEEADSYSKSVSSAISGLKQVITAKTLTLNEKYRKPITVKNMLNVALATNKEYPLLEGDGEQRRFIQFNTPLRPSEMKIPKDKTRALRFGELLMEYPKILLRLLMEYRGRWFEKHYDTTEFQTNAMKAMAAAKITKTKHAFIDTLCEALIDYTTGDPSSGYYDRRERDPDITMLATREIKGERYILIDKRSYSKLETRYMHDNYKRWNRKLVSAFKDVGILRRSVRDASSFDRVTYKGVHAFYAIPYSIVEDYFNEVYGPTPTDNEADADGNPFAGIDE